MIATTVKSEENEKHDQESKAGSHVLDNPPPYYTPPLRKELDR